MANPPTQRTVQIGCGNFIMLPGYYMDFAASVTASASAHADTGMTANNQNLRTIYNLWPACPLTSIAPSASNVCLVKGSLPL
jgi:hypothetical protein